MNRLVAAQATLAHGGIVGDLIENLKQLGAQRLIALAGVGAAVIGALVFMAVQVSRPQMDILFSGLDASDAGDIAAALEGLDAPFEVSRDGSVIRVPQERVGRLRMAMAEKGLPAGGAVGYELFDAKDAFGMTSFMQEVNRLRAMEGELARTIQSLSDVESARVHLVMAKRDPFSRDVAKPSASVVIRMRGRLELEARHASSIKHLVASAVPHLSPGAVSVLDARGGAFFADDQANPAGVGGGSLGTMRADIETRLSQAVEKVLIPHLGPGRVRVQVAAELRTEREVRREESFDPRGSVMRSRQVSDETERSRANTNEDPVTVEQNLPGADVDADIAAREMSETERTEELVNYEVSKIEVEKIVEPGDVARLSVAVIVDGVREAGPDGAEAYRPQTAAEIGQIENLVKSAVGFNAARGDVVTIESMRFFDLDENLPPAPVPSLGEILRQNLGAIVQMLTMLAFGALLIFGVIRPMLQRLIPAKPAAETAAPQTATLERVPGSEDVGEENAIEGVERPALPKRGMDETLDHMLEIRDVDGKVRASSVRKLGQIVEQYPDEVFAILRDWMYEDAA